jgi:hypothetical protein
MCALVQAIRKVKIGAGGPGLGDAKNPMHIIKTAAHAANARPRHSPSDSHSSTDKDTSFGQERRIVEDPSTQVDDDQQPPSGYEYYNEETLERRLSGTTATRASDEDLGRNRDIERGRSFGRRRKQVQADLEKGPED